MCWTCTFRSNRSLIMFQEMTQLCWMTQQYIWRPNDISLWSCIVKENKIMFSDVLKVYWKSRLWLIKSWVRQGVYLFIFFLTCYRPEAYFLALTSEMVNKVYVPNALENFNVPLYWIKWVYLQKLPLQIFYAFICF